MTHQKWRTQLPLPALYSNVFSTVQGFHLTDDFWRHICFKFTSRLCQKYSYLLPDCASISSRILPAYSTAGSALNFNTITCRSWCRTTGWRVAAKY
ncbi:uncharacterized protein [Rutidosis leptorrhynchoides]|uniref:uncharacterized protein isoform X2 n=1 Tax=Rutidosis leptorrhynchoides TaxID=125765 RepID=UPI003A98F9B6